MRRICRLAQKIDRLIQGAGRPATAGKTSINPVQFFSGMAEEWWLVISHCDPSQL